MSSYVTTLCAADLLRILISFIRYLEEDGRPRRSCIQNVCFTLSKELVSIVTSMTIKSRRKEYIPPPNKYNQGGKERYPWDLTIQDVAGFKISSYSAHTDPDTLCNERSDAAPLYAISWGWNASKRSGNLLYFIDSSSLSSITYHTLWLFF